MTSDLKFWWMMKKVVLKIKIQCFFWELRGLPICNIHGFHKQSWITGKCEHCERIKLIKKMKGNPFDWKKKDIEFAFGMSIDEVIKKGFLRDSDV